MPTIKQRKAAIEVGVNGGNISKAMRTAGYSENASKRTDKLTQTRGWAELMEEYLPDDLILKSLKEDIKKKPQNRTSELTLASKLKGKLSENINLGGNLKITFDPIFNDIASETKGDTTP